jgi:hypothetical protein
MPTLPTGGTTHSIYLHNFVGHYFRHHRFFDHTIVTYLIVAVGYAYFFFIKPE